MNAREEIRKAVEKERVLGESQKQGKDIEEAVKETANIEIQTANPSQPPAFEARTPYSAMYEMKVEYTPTPSSQADWPEEDTFNINSQEAEEQGSSLEMSERSLEQGNVLPDKILGQETTQGEEIRKLLTRRRR